LKVLIIGYGSIGKRHYKILSNLKNIKEIKIISKLNPSYVKKIVFKASDLLKYDPDYIIISSETSKHFRQLKLLNDIFKNKIILVEKPLFNSNKQIGKINNKIFVGYNLRFHPHISFLKDYISSDKKDKLLSVIVYVGSYMPLWRKNRNYTKVYSSKKNKGGGVEYDLSHEFDYVKWIFGKFKTVLKFNKKISNLKISSNDHLSLFGFFGKNKLININLNYYTKIPHRKLIADFNNKTIHLDLIDNSLSIKYIDSKKNIHKKINRIERDFTYKKQHLAIINGEFSNLCSYKDAFEDIKLMI